MRGLASLGVLIYHAILVWRMPDRSQLWEDALFHLLHLGYLGVSLFLVLCGFVLYYPYLCRAQVENRAIRINYWEFIQRRAWRILPTYYLVLFLLIASYYLGIRSLGVGGLNLRTIGSHLLMVHNLSSGHFYTINGSFWTIALIFQFYLIFPLLVNLIARCGMKVVLGTSICIAILASVLIFLRYGTKEEMHLYYSLIVRLPEFLGGMTAATIVARNAKPGVTINSRPFLLVVVCLLPFCILASVFLPKVTVGLNLAWSAIWSCCAILSSLIPINSRIWKNSLARALQTIGSFSFSVYLLHYPFLYATWPLASRLDPTIRIPIFFLLGLPAILLAIYACSFLIEKPFVSVRNRRTPQHSAVSS
jgi:peptidoglycan/LPS O-acetylase OafA/YrhL